MIDFSALFLVVTQDKITYNYQPLRFKFNFPETISEDVTQVDCRPEEPTIVLWGTERTECEKTEENYNLYLKPFIDLWQKEYDRIQEEEQAAQEEYAKFENRKERALNTVQADYDAVLERGFVRTSLGFDADISPDSSATLIGTQINLVNIARTHEGETPKTIFRDFYGLKRELDAVQVERLICEINGVQNYIRELKYTFKGAVKDSYDNDSLNACIETCVYSTLDYSNLDESGNPTVLPFVESKSIKDRIDTF